MLRFPNQVSGIYVQRHGPWLRESGPSNHMRWPKASMTVADRRRLQLQQSLVLHCHDESSGTGVASRSGSSYSLHGYQRHGQSLPRRELSPGTNKHELSFASSSPSTGRPSRPSTAPNPIHAHTESSSCTFSSLEASERLGFGLAGHSSPIPPIRYQSTSSLGPPATVEMWEEEVRRQYPTITRRPVKSNWDDIKLARSKQRWAARVAQRHRLAPSPWAC